MTIAIHKETGKELYIVSRRKSYGGLIICNCVSLEIARKYNFNVPNYITGLYYSNSLMQVSG